MNYTPQFHLPQWQGSDRVLMEDFNQMCSTMESAMTDLQEGLETATRLVKLREMVVPSGSNGYTVDLSGLPLPRLVCLELYIDLHNATKQSAYYTINGESSTVYQRDHDTNLYAQHYLSGNIREARLRIRLSPFGESVLIETGGAIYEGTYYSILNNIGIFHGSSFADMSSFHISGDPDQNVTVLAYGVLK